MQRPTDHQSGGVPDDLIAYMNSLPGYTLFLGAGNSNFRSPRVIEVEYDLFRDTDVIADAHCLPFGSGSFDFFFAPNVFEHLRRPFDAAREALRVLKPGGKIHIHTAFLQPLHEAPAHFFNATEFGVREWFAGFDDVEVGVSGNFNPIYTVSWIASELLGAAAHHLGPDVARKIGALRWRRWPGSGASPGLEPRRAGTLLQAARDRPALDRGGFRAARSQTGSQLAAHAPHQCRHPESSACALRRGGDPFRRGAGRSGLELIVVDDGSRDGSGDVIRRTLADLGLARVQFIEQPNEGAHRAIARGIDAASGEVLAILNSDDRFHPQRFARMAREFPESGDFLAFSAVTMIDAAGDALGADSSPMRGYQHGLYEATRCPSIGFALLRNNIAVTSGNFVFTRTLYDKIGGFQPFQLAHDWDFRCRRSSMSSPSSSLSRCSTTARTATTRGCSSTPKQ